MSGTQLPECARAGIAEDAFGFVALMLAVAPIARQGRGDTTRQKGHRLSIRAIHLPSQGLDRFQIALRATTAPAAPDGIMSGLHRQRSHQTVQLAEAEGKETTARLEVRSLQSIDHAQTDGCRLADVQSRQFGGVDAIDRPRAEA